MSIDAIKQSLLDKRPDYQRSFSIDDLYLTAQGHKPLVHSLEDYTQIDVHGRVKGGCFMVSFSILMICLVACCCSVFTCGTSLLIIPVLLPLLFVLPLFCL